MSQAISLAALAVVGWALCGATIGIGRKITSLRNALFAHAIAAPIIFVVVSAVYFWRFAGASPVVTAVLFVAIVIALDVFVIAMLVEKSFDMFRSVLGSQR
jgi:flagellin-like protein